MIRSKLPNLTMKNSSYKNQKPSFLIASNACWNTSYLKITMTSSSKSNQKWSQIKNSLLLCCRYLKRYLIYWSIWHQQATTIWSWTKEMLKETKLCSNFYSYKKERDHRSNFSVSSSSVFKDCLITMTKLPLTRTIHKWSARRRQFWPWSRNIWSIWYKSVRIVVA
jgi:hypothetical protein